jgi:inhibitor of KinA sporulation pathway (predicted exonuclease)
MAGTLQKVAEFRSFVKPTWRPQLSPFCTALTGITQVSRSHSIAVVQASRRYARLRTCI